MVTDFVTGLPIFTPAIIGSGVTTGKLTASCSRAAIVAISRAPSAAVTVMVNTTCAAGGIPGLDVMRTGMATDAPAARVVGKPAVLTKPLIESPDATSTKVY